MVSDSVESDVMGLGAWLAVACETCGVDVWMGCAGLVGGVADGLVDGRGVWRPWGLRTS